MAGDGLTPNFLFRLVVVGQLATEILGEAIAPSSLTDSEYSVLAILGAYEPLGPTELSERSGLAPATISDHLSRLERRGLVDRSPNPDDRRAAILRLSEEGRRANEVALEALLEVNSRVASELDITPETVRDTLVALEAALRVAADPEANQETSEAK